MPPQTKKVALVVTGLDMDATLDALNEAKVALSSRNGDMIVHADDIETLRGKPIDGFSTIYTLEPLPPISHVAVRLAVASFKAPKVKVWV